MRETVVFFSIHKHVAVAPGAALQFPVCHFIHLYFLNTVSNAPWVYECPTLSYVPAPRGTGSVSISFLIVPIASFISFRRRSISSIILAVSSADNWVSAGGTRLIMLVSQSRFFQRNLSIIHLRLSRNHKIVRILIKKTLHFPLFYLLPQIFKDKSAPKRAKE